MNVSEMVDYLSSYKGRSYTACPGIEEWLNAFGDSEEIYVTTLTSGLSGTYNSAMNAREIYLEEHQKAKIFVIDSLSTSSELLLITEKIYELKESGADFDKVCRLVTEYAKRTRLFYAFKSLHNFSQNGRVPKLLAKAIELAGLSIIGTASEEGKVKPVSKARGEQKVLKTLFEQMKEAGYSGGKVNITHVLNEKLANALKELILASFPNAQVEIYPSRGLVAYYAERGGIITGFEC